MIAGNVAFLPFEQGGPTIHGMLGLTANTTAAVYIGRRYLVLVSFLGEILFLIVIYYSHTMFYYILVNVFFM